MSRAKLAMELKRILAWPCRVTPLGHVLDAVHVGRRDEFLEQAELLALGVGEDEQGVDVRDSLAFLQHICRSTSSTLAAAWSSAAMTATYSVASLALMKGCIVSLTSYYCRTSPRPLPPRCASASSVARSMDEM